MIFLLNLPARVVKPKREVWPRFFHMPSPETIKLISEPSFSNVLARLYCRKIQVTTRQPRAPPPDRWSILYLRAVALY